MPWGRLRRAAVLAVLVPAVSPPAGVAAPGDLDPSFQGGVARVSGPEATGLALTSGGAAVVAGASQATPYPSVAHMRLRLDGSPAPGFDGGPVRTVFGYYRYAGVGAVAVQADDKAVIGGRVSYPDWGSYPTSVFLRYLPDGRLDPSFGTDGTVVLDLTPERATVEEVRDVAIDSAGNVVFLGRVNPDPYIGRLLPDGRLDPAFAGGAVRVASVNGLQLDLFAIKVTPDGGVLAVGEHRGRDPVLLRLTADGTLDTTFGDGGVSRLPAWGSLMSETLALGPEGTIVVGGTSLTSAQHENRFWAIRFTADGRVDARFGGPRGVSVQIPIPPRRDPYPSHLGGGARDIAVQANGKVLLAGDYAQDGQGRVEKHGAVVRLLADGSLDDSFGGGDGIVTVPSGSWGFEDIELQPDGRIVLSRRSGFSVWRLLGDGPDGRPSGTPPPAPDSDPVPGETEPPDLPDPDPAPDPTESPDARPDPSEPGTAAPEPGEAAPEGPRPSVPVEAPGTGSPPPPHAGALTTHPFRPAPVGPRTAPAREPAPAGPGPVVLVDRRGRAAVSVLCRGPATRRCHGKVRVRVSRRIAGERRFAVRARERPWRIATRLDARAVRTLRRLERLPARVEIRMGHRRSVRHAVLSG